MKDRALALLRNGHQQQREQIITQYRKRPHPDSLLAALSDVCDQTLRQLISRVPLPDGAALVAVGGYGRGGLYPYSDVDVLILLATDPKPRDVEAIQRLVAAMWDVGLNPSHSVRTVQQCQQ